MGKSVRRQKWRIITAGHFGLLRYGMPIRNPSGHVDWTGV